MMALYLYMTIFSWNGRFEWSNKVALRYTVIVTLWLHEIDGLIFWAQERNCNSKKLVYSNVVSYIKQKQELLIKSPFNANVRKSIQCNGSM